MNRWKILHWIKICANQKIAQLFYVHSLFEINRNEVERSLWSSSLIGICVCFSLFVFSRFCVLIFVFGYKIDENHFHSCSCFKPFYFIIFIHLYFCAFMCCTIVKCWFFFRASVDFPSIANCFSVGTRKLVEFIGLEIHQQKPNDTSSSGNSDSEQRCGFNDFSVHECSMQGKRAVFFIELCFMSHVFFGFLLYKLM